jgi:hypothetical protein
MKKSLILLLILVCLSCTKQPIEPTNSKEVKISIDYAFPTRSGYITPKGSTDYLNFYTKYVEGKILTPKTYVLTFTRLDDYSTPESSEDFRNNLFVTVGKWASKDQISILPGKYLVGGYSFPINRTIIPGTPNNIVIMKNDIIGDTCYIEFHDTLTITQTTASITLKAKYACSLILLNTTDVLNTFLKQSEDYYKDMGDWSFKTSMMKTEEFYHSFVRSEFVSGVPYYYNIQLIVNKIMNERVTINLWNYSWENSKYYYFEFANNNYTLAPMIGI